MYKILQYVIHYFTLWISLACDIIGILTFGSYTPSWYADFNISFNLKLLKHKQKNK